MDQTAIEELRAQAKAIRDILAAEPAALDRDRLRAVADAIDAKLLEVERALDKRQTEQ